LRYNYNRAKLSAIDSMGYLDEVLAAQRVGSEIENAVRARRVEVESMLGGRWGCEPRFYFGGSFAKKTAIAAQFDLDVVVYFPCDASAPSLLYDSVEARLRTAGHTVVRHNVALRLQYTPGWHVDVVPGRALDDSYEYADLWANDWGGTRQTSLKAHIALARDGDRNVVKLLKLWRWRNQVPVGSFVLELAAARALRDCSGSLEERLAGVLALLARLETVRLVDPANSANVVTDDLEWPRKQAIAAAAARALSSIPFWDRVL
jgi:hypothetical protein